MSNWQTCENCEFQNNEDFCDRCFCHDEWRPIPCPFCGGSLSEITEHKIKVGDEEKIRHYRHCFSCHFEDEVK